MRAALNLNLENTGQLCHQKEPLIMIKVITAIVCAFAAMLMIILSVATTYWLQWVIVSEGHNITHYRGLFKHCFESRDNVTNELIKEDSGCTGEYTDFKAGTDFVIKHVRVCSR